MAESTTNQAEQRRGSGQAVARREEDQGRGSFQRQQSAGGWLSSPFDVMDRMTNEMDRLFDRVFRDVGWPGRAWRSATPFGSGQRAGNWAPHVEEFQNGDRFIVRADLPGLAKDQVQVEVTANVLTIHGERREEHEEKKEGYYHSEREYGQFYRSIPLPEGVITDSAQASFKNGVLEITMQAPPAEATRGRRLEIKEGSDGGNQQ